MEDCQYQGRTYPPRNNSLGIAGFVLALLGLLLSWIPVFGWVLWVLGVVFSFIGVFKVPRGLAIAGLVISFIGLIFLIFIMGILTTAAITAALC